MFELADITVSHGGRRVLDVPGVALGQAGLTAILGHNGSGKSTLLSCLARQRRPDAGMIWLEGHPLSTFRQRDFARRVAYLPQRLPPVAGLTVRELVRLGRFPWRGAVGRWRQADHEAVDRALAETGTDHLADQLADDTSGGERQRAWIAMLLAQAAPILLLDEPTSALDLRHSEEVMTLLRRLADVDRQVIVVLHDINLAARHADRIVALDRGGVTFDGGPGSFLHKDVLSGLTGVPMTLLDRPAPHPPYAVIA
ncbi:Iron(3+)-hydroxamate import ATP-binding protein FhuC [Jannaschia seosinensis]|uniref:Iron(3+)-hydroxamate import ATP-binding protein FhuC n=1 Tax=Jannaschia seosinensis TaxID=313367 RepID=A0A0M7BB34_9RHOB|nr:ABC transporter ATP-binding protein [Jannaschia seosinensis]CUH39278.1 Iron(3+)-hydroxamate import ATP-binding protein FhuC [Jannaschia seosinensis]